MELTLDKILECVLLHLDGNLPLHTILKKEELNLSKYFLLIVKIIF